ncbi:MAG TPA: DUF350 domain-containing protein [Methylomirabilota bacterium]|jgi:uncharacterized membrane protein YjfL (UPF0719 family)|nr:DUF350 domain-containing protein [Methylomirabilota bacterium]
MTYGLNAVTYLLLSFALAWVGKLAYGVANPPARVDREVTARDNLAFAVPLGAYYLGILIVMGAPLSGQPRGDLLREALAVAGWGLLAILLLNVAAVVNRRLLFHGLDFAREILERRNLACGIVAAGSHIANALLVLGALADEGGLLPAAVFWVYAQMLLALAAAAFLRLVRYEFAAEIRRGNQAIALSVAGVFVAMANVLRMSISGPFEGWTPAFTAATGYALAGLILLFAARQLTDWVLLPGVTIHQEVVEQEIPNVGVGYLEALFYLGASFLIGWSL